MLLREHAIVLHGERATLRPMTEDDWGLLLAWNSDPDILYFSEDEDVTSRDIEMVRLIYRSVSQKAICFIIEYAGRAVGEGWLQRMNIERILAKCPGLDCRRI